MALWELLPKGEITRGLEVHKTLPDPTTHAYGPDVIYDDAKPDEHVTLRARGMDLAELQAEEVKARTRGTNFTYATAAGFSVTGRILSLNWEQDEHLPVFIVELRLRVTT